MSSWAPVAETSAADARIQFANAITAAEEKSGVLRLTRWRDGQSANVDLKLPVLGTYSGTAPYHCPKSKAIFEQGCRLIAKNGLGNADIPIHLNALALLASGNKEYHPMLADYAKKVAASLHPGVWTWYYGYGNVFLAGKYVAELAVDVRANDQGQWSGSFTVKSREFEISAQPRPVPAKVRKKRGQILTLARERMVNYWEQQKDRGNAHCKALALADLETAAVKVEESVGQGLEQGQTIYNITILAPCPQLGGKVKFQWSFNEFGDERSAAGVQLIKEAETSPPNP